MSNAARAEQLTPQATRPGVLQAVVTRRSRETADVALLEVAPAGPHPLLPPFEPGAHIDIHLPNGQIRQYSICSDPADVRKYRLGVLLSERSRGGSRAAHTLKAGDTITISEPRNHFPLLEGAGKTVLVAGGIGITPLLAMCYRLQALGAPFELHYCARNRLKAAFSKQLAQFKNQVRWHFDGRDGTTSFDPAGVLAVPDDGTHLYVCGPRGFMNYVVGAARASGWKDPQIHTEAFEPPPQASDEPPFEIVAERSGISVQVPGNQTIVQALAEAGIEVAVSCEQGFCGTCLTRVLNGTPDHRDSYQTDAEKSTNSHIALCCSRSRSGKLVLDI